MRVHVSVHVCVCVCFYDFVQVFLSMDYHNLYIFQIICSYQVTLECFYDHFYCGELALNSR